MSVIILTVDEVMRTLSNDGQYPFVVHDKEVDIVRFAMNTGFTDIALDEHSALRVMYQRPGETEVRAQTLTYHDTDGLRNFYDWKLAQSDLVKSGTLTVALCILSITGGEVSEWHTTPCAVKVLSTIHTDDSDEGDDTITPTVKERVAVLESMIQRVASGAPIVVSSTSAMTDTAQIYVLTTDGYWYYHDGTDWVAGGTYGAVATDTTLTQPGVPADAEAVGDAIEKLLPAEVKNALYTLLASATYTSDDMSDQLSIIGEWANTSDSIDTTARVVKENTIMLNSGVESAKEYGGITRVYKTSYPTTTLHLAGIIPTTGSVITAGGARLIPYDADGVAIDYVKENDGNYNRWAQDATGTMTEFVSPAWSVRAFTSIVFTVDMRYLDDAYMYNKTTGQVYFAGKNTPYYGMRNVSQAS